MPGKHIILEPLEEIHRSALYESAQDERIWTYTPSQVFGEHFHDWFERAMEGKMQRKQIPFAVRRIKDGEVIGSTRYYDLVQEHRRLSIGFTWYRVDAWGTLVNPECKLLLLKNAFENFQVNRVELVTDSRNTRSRAAMKKMGATEEGTLRQHMILENGTIRDSVLFSVISNDWPSMKINLEKRLAQ